MTSEQLAFAFGAESPSGGEAPRARAQVGPSASVANAAADPSSPGICAWGRHAPVLIILPSLHVVIGAFGPTRRLRPQRFISAGKQKAVKRS